MIIDKAVIDGFAAGLLSGGLKLHTNLAAVSHSLFGSLIALTMAWFGVQIILDSLEGEGIGKQLTKLLHFILLAGLVGWFLEAYEMVFYQGIYQGSEAVSDAIAGKNGAKQAFATAWNVFSDLIVSVWRGIGVQYKVSVGRLGAFNPFFAQVFTVWLLTAFIMLAAILMIVVALALFAVVYVMGNALVGLALALGPFFIPWLLWGTADFLFMGWLRFLLTACLYKVVAVTVMVMAKPAYESISALLGGDQASLLGEPLEALFVGIAVMVLATIIASLMMHVPQITGALLGGGRVDAGFSRNAGAAIQSFAKTLDSRITKFVFGSAYQGRSGNYPRKPGAR